MDTLIGGTYRIEFLSTSTLSPRSCCWILLPGSPPQGPAEPARAMKPPLWPQVPGLLHFAALPLVEATTLRKALHSLQSLRQIVFFLFADLQPTSDGLHPRPTSDGLQEITGKLMVGQVLFQRSSETGVFLSSPNKCTTRVPKPIPGILVTDSKGLIKTIYNCFSEHCEAVPTLLMLKSLA